MSSYAIVTKGGNVLLIKDSITNLWRCPGVSGDDRETLTEYVKNRFDIDITLGNEVFHNKSAAGTESHFHEVTKVNGEFKPPPKTEIRWADVTYIDRLDIKIDHKLAILKANAHKLYG